MDFGPWVVPTRLDPEVVKNYRIIPLPRMTGAKRDVIMLSSWVWVVNAKADAAKQAEAWKFTNYAQTQGDRWLPTAGYIRAWAGKMPKKPRIFVG